MILINLFLALLLMLYVKIKGVDFFALACGICMIYFYPILYFDNIHLWQVNTIYDVDAKARLCLIVGMSFLLLCGWLASTNCSLKNLIITNSHNFEKGSDQIVAAATKLLLCMISTLFLVLIYRHGWGIFSTGGEKVELMEKLGYDYKIFVLLLSCMLTLVIISKQVWAYIVTLLFVAVDIIFGFRTAFAFFFLSWIMIKFVGTGWKNVWIAILGILVVLVLIIIKQTNYFMSDFSILWDLLVFKDFADIEQMLCLINSESTSISLVFNLAVATDFSVPVEYWQDVLLSAPPLVINTFDIKLVQFDEYFKGVLLGPEGDSFASGMLLVGYATAGVVGVMTCFVFLAVWGYVHEWVMCSVRSIYIRAVMVTLSCWLLILFFRSDAIFVLSVLRSTFLVWLILYVITCICLRIQTYLARMKTCLP